MNSSQIAAARLSTPPLGAALGQKPTPSGTGVPFAEHVKTAIQEANRELGEAETQARQLAEGKGDIVEAMMALSKAELSLRHVVSLRNRVLESYQQIMRLQL
ncbi:MAG: flagellar hook-basal body complex protein FliE [bacterium]|nr:flagellar hook-basal body complex protein FliE [bacterium]MCP5067352.1 flagellar hook-basal body complex protein FliE [bacterium]